MDLTCYLYPGWTPQIRPAPSKRAWMDATPEAFAYRCLPLDIANAHGWELLCPCDFEASWTGEAGTEAVTLAFPAPIDDADRPVSLFGQGVVTFHVMGLFRTPPGWNLWVGGSPNAAKDGIQALSGVIETDWSPFTFTMNWRFTRPGTVRFRAGEPICFFFPVQRSALESFEPRFAPIDDAPELKQAFEAWSAGRDAFQLAVADAPPAAASDKWQKHYYRGVDVAGRKAIQDHRAKLRLADFAARPERMPRPHDAPDPSEAPPRPEGGRCPVRGAGPGPAAARPDVACLEARLRVAEQRAEAAERALHKREWLLQAMERHRSLSAEQSSIDYCENLSGEEFFERHYAANRPVVLGGEMRRWPALKRWTPTYLKRRIGPAIIEYQGDRDADPAFELEKDTHRREMQFDSFIDTITRPGAGNDAYITAFNSARNRDALEALRRDVRPLRPFLEPDAGEGMMWIGPAGTFTPLHHDLTNNLVAQVVGRKRVLLCPPSEIGKLDNARHVFSAVGDLEHPPPEVARCGRLADLKVYPVDLDPGDILFIPVGWWHQVRALDFSITLTYTNFAWPNDVHASYPAG